MKPSVTGFIFARGGSKGLTRKNIRLLAGKPLIAYAIDTARQCELVDRVIVSTDDEEIAEIAQEWGAEVPFIRPANLAGDTSPERAVWQHAIRTMQEIEPGMPLDVFLCIPTTAPLRKVKDVNRCIELLLEGDADIVITAKAASRSPYYNMVVIDERGDARLVIPPDTSIHQRQKAPIVYDMTTVAYAARPQYVLETDYIFDGKVKAVLVDEVSGTDIDTEFDLQVAEMLLSRVNAV